MNYFSAFRDREMAEGLRRAIDRAIQELGQRQTLMEVCGTHTWSIARHGIRSILPSGLRLLSGPGCPVCVTSQGYLDGAVILARQERVIVATFGDMMRVPGSHSSLEAERAQGRDVRPVYSPLEALKVARDNPRARVVFLGVGFETTAPTIAASLLEAREQGLENYLVYSAHKRIPPALRLLAQAPDLRLDGLICPPHVSSILGARAYRFLAEEYGIPCVITGFEPLDILQGILMLLHQRLEGRPRVEIQYRRAVREEGNLEALAILEEVFEAGPGRWRGLGLIPDSGLSLREGYRPWDAHHRFALPLSEPDKGEQAGCLCGEILKGIKSPPECPAFGQGCIPEDPQGPCMVSGEGTCAAYYRYGVAPYPINQDLASQTPGLSWPRIAQVANPDSSTPGFQPDPFTGGLHAENGR